MQKINKNNDVKIAKTHINTTFLGPHGGGGGVLGYKLTYNTFFASLKAQLIYTKNLH